MSGGVLPLAVQTQRVVIADHSEAELAFVDCAGAVLLAVIAHDRVVDFPRSTLARSYDTYVTACVSNTTRQDAQPMLR